MRRCADERGFTIIEVVVAALMLAVGLLAAFFMLVISDHASADVRAREGAVALARQITEDARKIPYSQIDATVVSQLQAMPGLASTSSGSSWTISRNRFTYTVTASVTTLNDPKDTSGAVDVKQVTASVGWTTFQGKSHTVSETTTLTRAGQDPGLSASGLLLFTSGAGVSGTPTAPVITLQSVSSLQFQVTAPTGTTAVVWTLNGAKQSSWNGSVPATGSTTWASAAWSLSGVSDGTYTVGAQAEDASGVDGPAVTIPVRLIRNVPSAPNVTDYGFNTNLMAGGTAGTAAELQWKANPELNVVGYRIYNPSGTKICETSTTTSYASCGATAWCLNATSCTDLNPPSPTSANLTYTVKALYYDVNNNLQEGAAKNVTLAAGAPVPPPPPTPVAASTQPGGSVTVTWTPPSGGTAVSFYRIYRGGNNYTNRYDTVSAASCTTTCTYRDLSGTQPSSSYYVSSVGGTTPGADMAESAATGPVGG